MLIADHHPYGSQAWVSKARGEARDHSTYLGACLRNVILVSFLAVKL